MNNEISNLNDEVANVNATIQQTMDMMKLFCGSDPEKMKISEEFKVIQELSQKRANLMKQIEAKRESVTKMDEGDKNKKQKTDSE